MLCPPAMQDGEWVVGTGKPEVFFTFGDEEKLRNRALYFIRNADKIDLDKVGYATSTLSSKRRVMLIAKRAGKCVTPA